MAYQFAPASSPFVDFSIGAFNGYPMRQAGSALSVAYLLKRVGTGTWQGIHVIHDGAGTPAPYAHILEFGPGNTATGDDTVAATWTTTATFTNTTDFMILGFTFDGTDNVANNQVWRWKVGAGAWTSENETVNLHGGATAIGAGYRHRLGNNPSVSDDGDYILVCAGAIKSNLSQATFETLDMTSFSTWQSVFTGTDAWLVGAEAIGSLTDRTGNGGDETARSAAGVTLVSDPAGWSWGGAVDPGPPILVMPQYQAS